MNFVSAMLLATVMAPAGEPTDYATAYKQAINNNQPLLVLVTAEWCMPCQNLKRTTLPTLVGQKSFRGFQFAMVDVDRDPDVARQLVGSQGVPQFVLFEKRDGKWSKKKLVGYQTVAKVESFIAPSLTRTAGSTVSAKVK